MSSALPPSSRTGTLDRLSTPQNGRKNMLHKTLLRTKFALKLILLASAGVSCGALASVASAAELTIAQTADANSLDPAFRDNTITGNIISHIFDSMLDRTPDMSFKSSLA